MHPFTSLISSWWVFRYATARRLTGGDRHAWEETLASRKEKQTNRSSWLSELHNFSWLSELSASVHKPCSANQSQGTSWVCMTAPSEEGHTFLLTLHCVTWSMEQPWAGEQQRGKGWTHTQHMPETDSNWWKASMYNTRYQLGPGAGDRSK